MNAVATEPLRILVAEDNEDHLFLTIRALHGIDGVSIEVDAVRDGQEALDYLYRRGRFAGTPRPNLILLDVKMPKVGGLEVLERIKTDAELRSIPVVVLSSSERREDVDMTYQLGGNSYVPKRSGPSGLREGIGQLSAYWTSLAALPTPPD